MMSKIDGILVCIGRWAFIPKMAFWGGSVACVILSAKLLCYWLGVVWPDWLLLFAWYLCLPWLIFIGIRGDEPLGELVQAHILVIMANAVLYGVAGFVLFLLARLALGIRR